MLEMLETFFTITEGTLTLKMHLIVFSFKVFLIEILALKMLGE